MILAQTERWNQNQLAKSFLKIPEFNFGNLPEISKKAEQIFRGKGTPSDALMNRARVIARTELNDTANRMHRSWTKAAFGDTKYINMNGDPVAQVCKDANAAGAMTWSQWEAGLGTPPRHPNCDSGLLAVPDDHLEIAEQQRLSDQEDEQLLTANP